MRKKKNGAARLSACSEFLLENNSAPMSDPAAAVGMAAAPVFLEVGAGKGGFACGMAKKYPDAAFFAMEKISDCVVIAAEKAKAESEPIGNLRFIVDTADNLTLRFCDKTVDRLFLNFSDPWSKKGYAKRRLTHRRYLAVYFNLLRDGGKLTFKTDNTGLFDFTLEELSAIGLTPDFVTRDLHSSQRACENVMTEYERNFSEQGMAINMLEVTKPDGYEIEIPDELGREREDSRSGVKNGE
jgi:tRNA (guanine-N7-)-methyltransferase